MNVGKFWLLMFLSVVIAILVFLETTCENQVISLTYQMSRAEAQVAQARQQNEMLRQLIQRVAIESQRDPALMDLLTKRGIRFSRPSTGGATPAQPGTAPSEPTSSSTPGAQ
jgi:hypothetical protein